MISDILSKKLEFILTNISIFTRTKNTNFIQSILKLSASSTYQKKQSLNFGLSPHELSTSVISVVFEFVGILINWWKFVHFQCSLNWMCLLKEKRFFFHKMYSRVNRLCFVEEGVQKKFSLAYESARLALFGSFSARSCYYHQTCIISIPYSSFT